MGRHATGAGQARGPRAKPLASSGRNVEGATYTVVDVRGERMLRCKGCEKTISIPDWWSHACAAPATP